MNGREITLDNAESLLKDTGRGIISKCEFKKKYNNIVNDANKILSMSMLTRNQNKMIKNVLVLKEPIEGSPYEQSDTTDMSDLKSEESNEQSGQGLKVLTPKQMLSRLPISLAQLKEGSDSEKLENEIRQIL